MEDADRKTGASALGRRGFLKLTGGVAGARQLPKCCSSSGMMLASVVSPVTMIVALSGRSQSRWNVVRSSRVNAAIEFSVPVPVKGIAYGCPSP